MMNRFVCHLSSLSGEQWYGSQRERGEGDTRGKKNSILNRTILQPAKKIGGLWTFNNPPNVTCQILFLNILRGSCFSTVMSRLESIFKSKLHTINHYWVVCLPFCWNDWDRLSEKYPLCISRCKWSCTLVQKYTLTQPLGLQYNSLASTYL